MKVIKNNAHIYKTLYESLEGDTHENSEKVELRFVNTAELKDSNKLESHFNTLNNINTQLKNLNDVDLVLNLLLKSLRGLITVEESQIFLFNENQFELNHVGKNCDNRLKSLVDLSFKNGIISWIFESKKSVILPNLIRTYKSDPRLNYLLIPIIERKQKKGILAIQTPLSELKENSFAMKAINVYMGLILPRIELIINRERLNSAINEAQEYKSKLANDHKLSAIGELTNGIIEDIIEPVQVIMSCTEFIEKEYENVDSEILQTINKQVKKVETVINRLTKFASINNESSVRTPCNLNKKITEFTDIILSSLRNDNYECILDLDESLPPILSNSNQLNQIFTNVFSLLRNGSNDAGGILIQSRYQGENVVINIFSTGEIINVNNNQKDTNELNLTIIKNLMEKHEGEFVFNSNESNGTSISLKFPFKRKIGR